MPASPLCRQPSPLEDGKKRSARKAPGQKIHKVQSREKESTSTYHHSCKAKARPDKPKLARDRDRDRDRPSHTCLAGHSRPFSPTNRLCRTDREKTTPPCRILERTLALLLAGSVKSIMPTGSAKRGTPYHTRVHAAQLAMQTRRSKAMVKQGSRGASTPQPQMVKRRPKISPRPNNRPHWLSLCIHSHWLTTNQAPSDLTAPHHSCCCKQIPTSLTQFAPIIQRYMMACVLTTMLTSRCCPSWFDRQ